MTTSFFEQMGGKYERQGDYLLPCLTLPAEEEQPVGIWGCGSPVATSAEGRNTDRAGRRDQRHKRYLKEHHRILYYNLLTACKLNSYLKDIEQRTNETFDRLVKEISEKKNATEKLKADNMIEWVRRMNIIRSRAVEIVNAEIIFAVQGQIQK